MTETESQILKAFVQDSDSDRYTSQDICDMLRDTLRLTPEDVTEHMLSIGWVPWRKDERLVWHKIL